MKAIFLICSALLFLALFNFPIGYYTFLRIIVTIGALIMIFSEYNKGFNFWTISFGLIAIIFNPIIPVYLNDKGAWMPIDLISGVLFLIKGLTIKPISAK